MSFIRPNASCVRPLCCALLAAAASVALAQRKPAKVKTDDVPPAYETEAFFIEAEKYYLLGDYEKSLAKFRKLAEAASYSRPAAYYKIASILEKGEGPEELEGAAGYIEKALKLDKENEHFYLLAASIYSKSARPDQAAKTLEALLKNVEDAEPHLPLLADAYRSAGKASKALKTYHKAEMLMGISAEVSRKKEAVYLEQGKPREAIAEAQKLVEAFPGQQEYTIELAQLLDKHERDEEAIVMLRRYIVDHPGVSGVGWMLSGFYFNRNDRQASEQMRRLFADTTIILVDKLSMVERYLAVIHSPSDSTIALRARSLLHQLDTLYPREPDVDLAVGALYMRMGKGGLAEQAYRRAIDKGSMRTEAWQNTLYLQLRLGLLDSLVKYSQASMKLFPSQPRGYYFNGCAQLKKKDYPAAIAVLGQAMQRVGSEEKFKAEIAMLLGNAHRELREYSKSDSSYEEALRYDPDNPMTLSSYSYALALRGKSLERAEQMAEQAVKTAPGNASCLGAYAWVLFMQGKDEQAEQAMKKAIETDPSDPVFFDHYGDILLKIGNASGALIQWEKAKRKGAMDPAIDKKINQHKP